MITVTKLLESGFFDAIGKIKEVGSSNGIQYIYVIPPIISNEVLYLMVITTDKCTIEKLLNFSSVIKSMFEKSFKLQVYEEDALKEGIAEESIFNEEYKKALNSCILIDNLKKDILLDLQWNEQAQINDKKNNKRKAQDTTDSDSFYLLHSIYNQNSSQLIKENHDSCPSSKNKYKDTT